MTSALAAFLREAKRIGEALGGAFFLEVVLMANPRQATAEQGAAAARELSPCDLGKPIYKAYGGCADVGFVVGTVTDIEILTSFHDATGKVHPGAGSTLIKLAAQTAIPEAVREGSCNRNAPARRGSRGGSD
jgi:hypothetical protein